MPLVIDSHHHLWQRSQPFDYRWLDAPELEPIRRDYLPSDLAPLLRNAGVDRTVVVQTQHNLKENDWALSLAEQHDFIAGVVGWVDLASSDCERQLLEYRRHSKFVGVRHVTQDEPDDDFIVRPDVLRGLKTLEKHRVPFDLLFFVRHLRHAATVAQKFPNLPLVLDHLAKPMIKAGRLDNWGADFRRAAANSNVYCKLSGMVTEADWTAWKPAELRPYVDIALESFGPDRCMFGSDWPVCELAASYTEVVATLRDLLAPLSQREKDKIFGDTATSFYRLPI
jgi:L-fuconolactonase